MATIISPQVSPDFPSTVVGPADGDLANAASVNGAFQSLENGVDMARQALYGAKLRPSYRISDVGPATPKMTIDPPGAVVLTRSGGTIWTIASVDVATEINLKTSNGGVDLAVKTRYYVYLTLVAGVPTYSVSTTAPDAKRRYMNGNTDFAYIATFLVDPATPNKIIPSMQSGGLHLYTSTIGLPLLSGGSATVFTSFATYITAANGEVLPAWARNFLLRMSASASDGTADIVQLADVTGGGGAEIQFGNPVGGDVYSQNVWQTSGDFTNVWYNWVGAGSLNVKLLGWQDPD